MIARSLALALALALPGCTWSGDPVGESALEDPEGAAPVDGAPGSSLVLAGDVDVGTALRVAATRITVSARDAAATGAVEMARPVATASTALARDSWKIVVDLEESAAGSVPAGAKFVARLDWDGADRGSVRFEQAEAAPEVEGVRVTFDLGRELATQTTYVLAVERAAVEPVVVRLATAANLTWTTTDGTNAPIRLAAGTPVEFQVANEDGGFHNLLVADAAGTLVAGPTPNVQAKGATAMLAWTPVAGEFAYVCKYHAATMTGAIVVE